MGRSEDKEIGRGCSMRIAECEMRNRKRSMNRRGDSEIKGREMGRRINQDTRITGNQDIRDRRREMKEVRRDFKIFLLILTMAWVGGTSLGQAFTH